MLTWSISYRFELLLLLHLFLGISGCLLFSFLIDGEVSLSEIFSHQFVVIDNLGVLFVGVGVVLFEYFVHIFRIESEVAADPVNPCLVHSVEAISDDLPDFEIKQGNVLVEVHFDDVGDQQKGELHLLGFRVLLQTGGDVLRIIDILV